MRRNPTLLVAGSLLALVILAGGCSKDNTTTPGSPGTLNLTSDFGGYTATDEPVAFGDPEFEGMMDQDPIVDDPAFLLGEADSLRGMAGAKIYAIAIRWGMLTEDSTVTQITDWSGSLTLNHGFIHVVRTIRFEEGQDHLVRPRLSRRELSWVSFTSKSFDGLMLTLIVPPAPPDSDWSDNQLDFQSAPYSRVFTLAELEHLNEIVDVGSDGEQIAFNAVNLTSDSCATGQLEGRWLLNPSHKNGHFMGKWMSDDGLVLGGLRGHFGIRPKDEKVFFGKYIGLDGHFRGLIRGTWGFDLDDSTKGWFDGIWAGHNGRGLGELHGRWESILPDSTAIVQDDDEGHGNGNGNGHMNGRGHDPDPKHDPKFGTGRWTPGFFSGVWDRNCSTPGDSTIGN